MPVHLASAIAVIVINMLLFISSSQINLVSLTPALTSPHRALATGNKPCYSNRPLCERRMFKTTKRGLGLVQRFVSAFSFITFRILCTFLWSCRVHTLIQ